ncbi:hypothetical protein RN001_005327 [Aquatica leii]|uniref:Uncharacterized protein n=1 Tax=Aquatica leii TaxID=1421715 RepID=A0AAN7PCK6_9COLE|nr:hypothetical protein RN001_005327 [Aquatica leii]
MASTSGSTSESNALVEDQVTGQDKEETLNTILNIKDVLKKSLANMSNIQDVIENAFKATENEKALKLKLEEEVSEIETDLQIETRKRDLIRKQILSMRKLSNDIGNVLVFCQETLKSILKGVETISGLLVTQNTENIEAITYLSVCYKDLESQETELANEVMKQREQNNNHILNLDKEILKMKEDEEKYKKELNSYHNLTKEFTEKSQSLLEQISELEKSYIEIKDKPQEKDKLQNELLSKMQKDKEQFQLLHDEATNNLLDIKDRILKKQSEISILERAQKTQRYNNEELLEKIKTKESSSDILKIEIADLKKTITDVQSQLDNDELELQTTITTKTEALIDLEQTYTKKQQFLVEIDRNIINYSNSLENLRESIKKIELEIVDLSEINDKCLQDIDNAEQHQLQITSEHQNLIEETNKLSLLITDWKKDQIELTNKKTAELSNYNVEIEKLTTKERELKNSITHEMHAIQLQSDVKTFQLKKELEEKSKLFNTEKELLVKKIQEVCASQAAEEAELQKLTGLCTILNEKIQNSKKLNKFLATLNNIDDKEFASPSVPNKPNSVPFVTNKRPALFDELSGSSVEGTVTMADLQKYQEQRKFRHQLREQRKAKKLDQKKKKSEK